MLSLKEIKKYYPATLQIHERFIMREYLQYKILEIVFDTQYQQKLSFLGGTCLRIVYDNNRFSENLDFDNFKLSLHDFREITKSIEQELIRLGFDVEMRNTHRGAYHCYIRFPELLYNEGLSNYKEEKILIQLDTESHNFDYKPDPIVLNKFDVFTQINVTPADILLSQKFYALINRKRNKGRDFFDIVFLLARGLTPNYEYLKAKINIENPEELRSIILEKCDKLSMEDMAEDVKAFLFNPRDLKKILLFPKYIEQANLKK